MIEDDGWSDLPVESEFTREQRDGDEDGLRAGVSGLAGGGVEELLAAVAGFAAQTIPGVDGVTAVAGVRCPSDGAPPRIQSWTATAELAHQIGAVQHETFHEGPCVSCIQMRCPVVSGSLGSDQRWPRFGGRVARLGVHSALSLPLLITEEVVGAIGCFAFHRNVFDEHAVRLGAQFAELAAGVQRAAVGRGVGQRRAADAGVGESAGDRSGDRHHSRPQPDLTIMVSTGRARCRLPAAQDSRGGRVAGWG
jgi:hypothetical protein